MTTIPFLLLIAWASFILSACQPPQNSPVAPVANIDSSFSSIHWIKRTGNSYERGHQYGTAFKVGIQGQLTIWEQLCQEEIELSLAELYLVLKEQTGFLKAIEQYTPDLLEEVKGIAAGAEVAFEALLTLNLAEETIVYFSGGYQSCTNIALQLETEQLLAYNLDLPVFLRRFKPIFLQDRQQLTYAFPGILATGGMNQHFALSTNSLPDLRLNTNGLPLPFLIRRILDCSSLKAATRCLQQIPLGAPQNIMLVGRTGMYDVECSAEQKTTYPTTTQQRFLYHTNHTLVNTDWNNNTLDSTACTRFHYLDSLFANTNVNKQVLQNSIRHKDSGIRSEENYLSFLVSYPSDTTKNVRLELLYPDSSTVPIILQFGTLNSLDDC